MEIDKEWEAVLKSKELKSLDLNDKQLSKLKGICEGLAQLVVVGHILNNKKIDGKCALCEQPNTHFRGAKFGGKDKSICSKCLAQFKVYTKEQYVVLEDRYE